MFRSLFPFIYLSVICHLSVSLPPSLPTYSLSLSLYLSISLPLSVCCFLSLHLALSAYSPLYCEQGPCGILAVARAPNHTANIRKVLDFASHSLGQGDSRKGSSATREQPTDASRTKPASELRHLSTYHIILGTLRIPHFLAGSVMHFKRLQRISPSTLSVLSEDHFILPHWALTPSMTLTSEQRGVGHGTPVTITVAVTSASAARGRFYLETEFSVHITKERGAWGSELVLGGGGGQGWEAPHLSHRRRAWRVPLPPAAKVRRQGSERARRPEAEGPSGGMKVDSSTQSRW